MKLTVAAVLAFAAAVLGKPVLTNSNFDIEEGVPFTLTWTDAQGPVTISLMTGDPGALTKVTDLTSGVSGDEFTFTLSDLPSGTYAIKITDSSPEPNYSKRFDYVGTGTVSSSTVSTSSRSSTSRSSTETTTSTSTETESESTTTTEESTTTTESTMTTTTTRAATTTRDTEATNTPANTNNGQRFASPLALIAVTVAALVFFN